VNLAKAVWPSASISVGSDRDSLLAGAIPSRQSGVCVNAGTGSCVIGVKDVITHEQSNKDSREVAIAGGKGHVIGDEGSAYWIGLKGLKAAGKALRTPENCSSTLGALVLRDICGNGLDDMALWSTRAGKGDVAGLCGTVFEAANNGDHTARNIVEKGAKLLAFQALEVVGKLSLKATDIQVFLVGSVFARQPSYVELFRANWVTKDNVSNLQLMRAFLTQGQEFI
jgi:N-acetylglucosamine kinase-like BadF-type ATPase